MKVVAFGATRGIGRAVVQTLAARGDRMFLLGRDTADLERSARDLEARGAASPVGTAACDLLDPGGFGSALDAASRALEGLETVVVTAGLFGTQDALESDPERTAEMLTADFTNTILFCEEARRRMLAAGGGTLCVCSSVAGERGRSTVVLYGAAKAGLSHYLEGLDSRFRGRGLRTVCVKPGFIRTSMTAGLQPPPFAADPQEIAPRIVRAIDRGTPVVYAPPIWRGVMTVIRLLPRALMRRLRF